MTPNLKNGSKITNVKFETHPYSFEKEQLLITKLSSYLKKKYLELIYIIKVSADKNQ